MEPKEILLELRTRNRLSQEQLAEQVHVTRQAVSRWETGETVPNTETLKLLSSLFDVSINTLLGSPTSAGSRMAPSTRRTASGVMPTGNSSTPAWRNCWISWSAIYPTRPGPRNRSEPILKPSCRSWITGSRDNQDSHPRKFRRWESCYYAARRLHCSGMEFCVDLQYNDPSILFLPIGEVI